MDDKDIEQVDIFVDNKGHHESLLDKISKINRDKKLSIVINTSNPNLSEDLIQDLLSIDVDYIDSLWIINYSIWKEECFFIKGKYVRIPYSKDHEHTYYEEIYWSIIDHSFNLVNITLRHVRDDVRKIWNRQKIYKLLILNQGDHTVVENKIKMNN